MCLWADDLTKQAIVLELFLNEGPTLLWLSYILHWDNGMFINSIFSPVIFPSPPSYGAHFRKVVFLLQAYICGFVWLVSNTAHVPTPTCTPVHARISVQERRGTAHRGAVQVVKCGLEALVLQEQWCVTCFQCIHKGSLGKIHWLISLCNCEK